jgi:hypothetical protein
VLAVEAVVMVGNDSPDSLGFPDKVKWLLRDPNFMLDVMFAGWEKTKNPYYSWYAIKICTKHKKQFPTWVVDYLADCANRMLSEKAKQSNDLRKIIPSILGFPAKRGPGRPLDPDRDPDDKLMFALHFAIEIEKGKKPSVARRQASTFLSQGRSDKIDDKTLQRWLKDEFDLESAPRTITEWKSVMRAHYGSFYNLIQTRFRGTLP